MWSRNIALDVCKEVEALCPKFGCHVALTGGLLYKDGPRKDLDLLFYRVRQVEKIDEEGLLQCLSENGFTMRERFGWVQKAVYWDMDVDMFFPEEQSTRAPSGLRSRPMFGSGWLTKVLTDQATSEYKYYDVGHSPVDIP